MKKRARFRMSITCCLVLPLIFFSLAFVQTAAASQDKPIKLKFGHLVPPNSPMHKNSTIPWINMAEKATNGKVKIEDYPAGSLFKSKEAITAVETGVADIAEIPLGYFTGRFNLTEVLFLPFLLKSNLAEVNSQIAQELYETTPEIQREFRGMKMLFLFTSSPYFIATIKKPVRNMGDLEGMKIRTVGKIPIEAMKIIGARPVMIPLPSLYESAAKGVIDGALIMEPMLADFKLYEVFNYWTDVSLWSSVIMQAMNLNKWNSLPADVKNEFMSVCGVNGAKMRSRGGYGPQLRDQDEALIKKEGQKYEKVELDVGQIDMWRENIGKPIWDEWVKEMEKKNLPGQKILDKAQKLVENYE